MYNIGGGRDVNCSVLEAIALCEEIADRELDWEYVDENRIGDHIWWISDSTAFRAHHPDWSPRYDLRGILEEIYEHNADRLGSTPGEPCPIVAWRSA